MIFEAAGIAGVNPWRYTMRELYWMANAKQYADWNWASNLIATLINVNVDKRNQVTPDQCHPFRQHKKKRIDGMITVKDLKAMASTIRTKRGRKKNAQ